MTWDSIEDTPLKVDKAMVTLGPQFKLPKLGGNRNETDRESLKG